MGVNVDLRMNIIACIAKILDDIGFTNSAEFDLKNATVEDLHEFLEMLDSLYQGVNSSLNQADHRR
jgi:hypothetical protein